MDLFPLPIGMTVLLTIALAVAFAAHWRIRHFWRASLLSAVATVSLFAVACLLQGGVPDPLEPIAIAYFAGFGLLVAVVVGLLFKVARPAMPTRA